MKKTILSLLITVLFTSNISAQAWVKNKGDGYFKLSETGLQSSKLLGPDGSTSTIRTTGIYSTSLYAEYGLTKKLTAIANVPFFVRSTLNQINYNQSGKVEPLDAINAFGDVDITIKYGLITNKPTVFSATILLGLPTGITEGGYGKILQSGDGEFNQMFRLDVSHSFYPKPFYVSAYGAFNNRTRDFSDELRYGFDVGYTNKKWVVALHINSIIPFKNGTATNVNNGIFSNNLAYFYPAIEVGYSLTKKWGLSTSAGYPLQGKNILAATSISGGFYYKLQ